MKPSQIKKRMDDILAMPEMLQLKAAQRACKEHLERLEELRSEKSKIIDTYGAKIKRIRQSNKLDEEAFMAFRKAVYAEPDEDKRMDVIDAKLAELSL